MKKSTNYDEILFMRNQIYTNLKSPIYKLGQAIHSVDI